MRLFIKYMRVLVMYNVVNHAITEWSSNMRVLVMYNGQSCYHRVVYYSTHLHKVRYRYHETGHLVHAFLFFSLHS